MVTIISAPHLFSFGFDSTEQPGQRLATVGQASFIWSTDAAGIYLKAPGNDPIFAETSVPVSAPDFSPTGSEIVFSSEAAERDNSDLFVMDLQSGEVQRITTDPADENEPVWSPDGKSVAFEQFDAEGHAEIMVLNLTDLTVRQVTANEHLDVQPKWSPDSQRLAFTRNTNDQSDIWVVDLDSMKESRLTGPDYAETSPTWSPDGSEIAYIRTPLDARGPLAGRDVWRTSVSDRTPVQVTRTDEAAEFAPAWLSDSEIAYVQVVPGEGADALLVGDLDGNVVDRVAQSVGAAFDWRLNS